MKAAEKGHEKVAEQLIALNAELNLQNSVRSTHDFLYLIIVLSYRIIISYATLLLVIN